MTQDEVNACKAAAVVVISDCPEECGECTAEGAGCILPETMVIGKFSNQGMPATSKVYRTGFIAVAGIALVTAASVVTARIGRLRGSEEQNALLLEVA